MGLLRGAWPLGHRQSSSSRTVIPTGAERTRPDELTPRPHQRTSPVGVNAPYRVAPDTYVIPELVAGPPGAYVAAQLDGHHGRRAGDRRHGQRAVAGRVDGAPPSRSSTRPTSAGSSCPTTITITSATSPPSSTPAPRPRSSRTGSPSSARIGRWSCRSPGCAGSTRASRSTPATARSSPCARPSSTRPTTRGLFDTRTGVYWAVDCFASLLPGHVTETADVAGRPVAGQPDVLRPDGQPVGDDDRPGEVRRHRRCHRPARRLRRRRRAHGRAARGPAAGVLRAPAPAADGARAHRCPSRPTSTPCCSRRPRRRPSPSASEPGHRRPRSTLRPIGTVAPVARRAEVAPTRLDHP